MGDEESSEITGQNDGETELTEKTGFDDDNNINYVKINKQKNKIDSGDDISNNSGSDKDNEQDNEGEDNEQEEVNNEKNDGNNNVNIENNEGSNTAENKSSISHEEDE